MSDQRITQLPALLQAEVAVSDVLPIVDVSASETKKVTSKALWEAGADAAAAGSIDLEKLDQNSATKLNADVLLDASITSVKLAHSSTIAVQGAAPTSGNYEGRGWLDNGTGELWIYDNGSYVLVRVGEQGLLDGAVVTSKLADLAVTTDKVSPLGTTAYANQSVTSEKLATGAVGPAALAAGAVGTSALAIGAVTEQVLGDDAVSARVLATGSVTADAIGASQVTADKLSVGAVGTAALADGSVTADKLSLADGSVSGTKLIDGSVTVNKLGVGSVTTTRVVDQAITTPKLADASIDATKIVPNSLPGSQVLAPGSVTSNELAGGIITIDKMQDTTQGDVVLGRNDGAAGPVQEVPCTAAGRALIAGADASAQRTALGLGSLAVASGTWAPGSSFSGTSSGTNTGDQTISLIGAVVGSGTGTFSTALSSNSVDTSAIVDGAVTGAKFADDSITAQKLADNSSAVVSVTTPSASGNFIGQLHVNDNDGIGYYYSGTTWQQLAGFTALTFNESTPFIHTVSFPSGRNAPQVNITLEQQAPNQVWAGPATGSSSNAPTFRLLVGADLPVPNGTNKGGIYSGEGTVVEPDGRLHLAPAEATVLGGVSVDDASLSVDVSGRLTHVASPLAAGTYTKVSTDAKGHVVSATTLSASDIPNLDASKITSGFLSADRMASGSVTREALADYAIAYIQEENPGIVNDHSGCLWLQESTGQLRMWNGNSWYPVGFGRLTTENLRWGGIIDATTDQVTVVTEAGATAGLTVGNSLPAATDSLGGVYVVVSVAGSNISVTPGVSYDAGDWALCVNQAQGWVRIDLAVGGGGGGADYLDDLLDVQITSPTENQVLAYNSTLSRWENKPSVSAPVSSVFGRTGAVVAVEGDYTLDLLGDVDLTTTPPAANNILQFVNSKWVPVAPQALSPTTTQGDLIRRGATGDTRLAIGTAGQFLAVNPTGTDPIWSSLPNATDAARGIVELATSAEAVAGVSTTLAVTPAGVKAGYLPLDFSSLPLLP